MLSRATLPGTCEASLNIMTGCEQNIMGLWGSKKGNTVAKQLFNRGVGEEVALC